MNNAMIDARIATHNAYINDARNALHAYVARRRANNDDVEIVNDVFGDDVRITYAQYRDGRYYDDASRTNVRYVRATLNINNRRRHVFAHATINHDNTLHVHNFRIA